ncbi:MAG TPA: ABC transporter permease [bacterium]|nr:ABC transporter permease [Candidatus Omnitrophota bacterium]HOJ60663.1 ABC transporter permease [bacterium]HOL93883.1 ABC transporter permease [bacterium]HPP00438.1 ABC transporter permease [bacterium]HXK95252.1 ABC transporter permease [bacterium]
MAVFLKQKMALTGLILTSLLVGLAAAAPWLTPYRFDGNLPLPAEMDGTYEDINALERSLLPPSADNWLGTDKFGRDVFTRVLYGGRISLFVGFISQGIALLIGVPLGCLAGYFRGKTDAVVMWLINVFWSFPYLLLVLAMDIALSHMIRSPIVRVFLAVGLVSWVLVARIVRGQVLSIKENAYIEAARAFGFSSARVMIRHLAPNLITPVFVVVTLGFAEAVIAEAALSYLGLGVQPPIPSWGRMINDGYGYILAGTGWWVAVFPGIAIMVAVLGLNLLGDGLRDYLDPHLKDELEGTR